MCRQVGMQGWAVRWAGWLAGAQATRQASRWALRRAMQGRQHSKRADCSPFAAQGAMPRVGGCRWRGRGRRRGLGQLLRAASIAWATSLQGGAQGRGHLHTQARRTPSSRHLVAWQSRLSCMHSFPGSWWHAGEDRERCKHDRRTMHASNTMRCSALATARAAAGAMLAARPTAEGAVGPGSTASPPGVARRR